MMARVAFALTVCVLSLPTCIVLYFLNLSALLVVLGVVGGTAALAFVRHGVMLWLSWALSIAFILLNSYTLSLGGPWIRDAPDEMSASLGVLGFVVAPIGSLVVSVWGLAVSVSSALTRKHSMRSIAEAERLEAELAELVGWLSSARRHLAHSVDSRVAKVLGLTNGAAVRKRINLRYLAGEAWGEPRSVDVWTNGRTFHRSDLLLLTKNNTVMGVVPAVVWERCAEHGIDLEFEISNAAL